MRELAGSSFLLPSMKLYHSKLIQLGYLISDLSRSSRLIAIRPKTLRELRMLFYFKQNINLLAYSI